MWAVMIIVRNATGSDLPELSRLWQEKLILQQQADYPVGLESSAKWIEAAGIWLADEHCVIHVAQAGSDLVGYIIGWVQNSPPGLFQETMGAVTDLVVDAHSHHSGVGRQLLASLREWFAQLGITTIIAYVPAHLAVAQAFWRAQGAAEWTNILWLK
jgi:GNAT superfamily N-acetyltransferase